MKVLKSFCLKDDSSQGKNLALNVLCVPNSLDCGNPTVHSTAVPPLSTRLERSKASARVVHLERSTCHAISSMGWQTKGWSAQRIFHSTALREQKMLKGHLPRVICQRVYSVYEDGLTRILHPTPHTLHPTPYTLHPAPCTLHPTPCTLHPAPHTMHPTPYTLHPTPYTPHPTRIRSTPAGVADASSSSASMWRSHRAKLLNPSAS